MHCIYMSMYMYMSLYLFPVSFQITTDPDDMLSFASNLLCLDIGEGLLSLVNDAETKARETVHQAEEELEGQLVLWIMHSAFPWKCKCIHVFAS